jgi:hypothetical protein
MMMQMVQYLHPDAAKSKLRVQYDVDSRSSSEAPSSLAGVADLRMVPGVVRDGNKKKMGAEPTAGVGKQGL